MAISDAQKIGEAIGTAYYEQDIIKDNLSGNDAAGEISAYNSELILITGTILVNGLTIATDSFVPDHPVYGELNSAVLVLDGGYTGGIAAFTFPGTFPMTFAGGTSDELFSGNI